MDIRSKAPWIVVVVATIAVFSLLVTPAGSAASGAEDGATVVDDDDDDFKLVTIQIDNVEVNESDESITFTVWKEERTPVSVPIVATTRGIEATPGVDYVDDTIEFSLARNKNSSETVTFKLIDDAIAEGAERFSVQLSVPWWVIVEDGGIGTIVDDDEDEAGIEIDVGDGVEVVEGEQPDVISVWLLSQPETSVAIAFSTDTDQLNVEPGILEFDATNWSEPQQAAISALGDGVVEDDPHIVPIKLDVSTSDPFYAEIPLNPINVTIQDQDVPAATIAGPIAGIPGKTASFEAITNGSLVPVSYVWEAFLDGNPVDSSTKPTFALTPPSPGAYIIRVALTDTSGEVLAAFVDYTALGDVAGSPFVNDIVWLAEEGITKGCNPPANDMFCPDETLTRGQMAAFLVRFFDLTDSGDGDLFIDDDNSVFEDEIDILATAGITTGCNPPASTHFCPDELMDRGHMAGFLSRALALSDEGGGDLFVDDDAWIFEPDIDKLATAGITRGCNPPVNDRYCPGDLVTRGQMAAFLHRSKDLLTE